MREDHVIPKKSRWFADLQAGTLAFGGAEGVIYTGNSSPTTISAPINATKQRNIV